MVGHESCPPPKTMSWEVSRKALMASRGSIGEMPNVRLGRRKAPCTIPTWLSNYHVRLRRDSGDGDEAMLPMKKVLVDELLLGTATRAPAPIHYIPVLDLSYLGVEEICGSTLEVFGGVDPWAQSTRRRRL